MNPPQQISEAHGKFARFGEEEQSERIDIPEDYDSE